MRRPKATAGPPHLLADEQLAQKARTVHELQTHTRRLIGPLLLALLCSPSSALVTKSAGLLSTERGSSLERALF